MLDQAHKSATTRSALCNGHLSSTQFRNEMVSAEKAKKSTEFQGWVVQSLGTRISADSLSQKYQQQQLYNWVLTCAKQPEGGSKRHLDCPANGR